MWKLVFSAVLLVIVLNSTFAKDLPSYIKVCKRNNPNLRKCLLDNVEILRPRFKVGVPELLIPSLEPLEIPEATLSTGDNFKATFKDIKLFNAYDFKLNDFDIDLDKHQINLNITFPRLRIKSIYNINGRILILNLDGEGPADGNYTNVQGILSLKGTPYQKHKKDYIRWEREKFDLIIEKVNLFFDRIFGNNEQLNNQTNKVINENIDTIIEELQPVIKQVVSEFILGIINRLFARFSINELFPSS